MTAPELSSRQQRLAAASTAAAVAARASAEQRKGHPPAAGDRYLLPATSDLPIEWILLERHPESPAFLAVLADVHPLVDSADFPIQAGALRLRCRAKAWLMEAALDPALRVGAIDRITLEKARRKVQELERGPDPAVEAEISLEYLEWQREVMSPVLAALGSSPLSAAPAARPPGSPKRTPVFLAAAASILLVAGLAAWAAWQGREIARLDSEKRTMEEVLESERSRSAQALRSAEGDSLRRFTERMQEERAKVAELQERLAQAEKREPGFPEALLNVPVAILNPAELLRGGEPQEVLLDPAAPYLTVALNLGSEAEYPSYRAVLRRNESPRILWQSDKLQDRDDRLQFSLSPSLFSPGIYRIDVSGLRGGRAEPVGDYELKIERGR